MLFVRENVFLVVAAVVVGALSVMEPPALANEPTMLNASLDSAASSGMVGSVLVGLRGDLGDAEGVVVGLTAEYLDQRCGSRQWEVWYETDSAGQVIPASVDAECGGS